MKSWRGVPVLVSVLSGLVVGCGPVPEGGVGEEERAVQEEELVAGEWEVCDDVASQVLGIPPGRVNTGGTFPAPVHGNGRLFFRASDLEHGEELWSATESGVAALVKDVNPRSGGSHPRSLTVLGRWVYFVADDGEHGPELWRTDGTAKRTELVKDIFAGRGGSVPEQLTVVGDTLYFTAITRELGRELWRSNGTARGTVLVRDFAPGEDWVNIEHLTAWDDGLSLVTSRWDRPPVLWRVDKQGRTFPLFTMGFGTILELEAAGRQLFFTADAGTDEADLWVTRSTPETATWLRHFPGEPAAYLTAMEDSVFFVAGGEGFTPGDPLHGAELWTSDGTVRGTRLVRDINPGPKSAFSLLESTPQFATTKGVLYFAADDGGHGRELWRSDGTPWGTWMVRDLVPGEGSGAPEQLSADSGQVFFSAATPASGREPWSSGGHFWDTKPLRDIAPGTASSNPSHFVRSGWEVFFIANEGTADQRLWSVPVRPTRSCGERTR
ncbi:hypothetical protein HPC49_40135 [Pyxidicoccus fallax]|uniref:Lipoprotein n=1 Tax=Pyxidicoccus fallax TaxID=394095 RepID=A0A848LTJ5_9BACT|nr:ELWxxDGT repeat protein [Pyxidicoccus fallax]NMO21297.1 hypothetical protein [Pyxidicoccus fallax]NPC84410.1 hypothetical protein [Pyxidicoccus fallax]